MDLASLPNKKNAKSAGFCCQAPAAPTTLQRDSQYSNYRWRMHYIAKIGGASELCLSGPVSRAAVDPNYAPKQSVGKNL